MKLSKKVFTIIIVVLFFVIFPQLVDLLILGAVAALLLLATWVNLH